ncbi:MAG: winged-helix domain-containing protein, partial [Myxococcales bacterium]|nr:winged-helix domain-containing protein [Myxococcales bacterium]
MSTAPQSLPGLTLTPGVHPDLRIAADRHAQALAEAEDDLEVTPLERGMEGADAVLLAGPDAWQTLRHLRTAGCTLPVAVATDGPPPSDRPSLEPVLLLRRGQRVASVLDGLLATRPLGELALEGGVLDVQRGVFLRRDGASVRLSGLEWLLLTYLAARTDRPVSREELQLQVWDHRRPVPTRAVDMAISRTRKKIEPDPADP